MEAMPKDRSAAPPPAEYLPQHIGIIMDGNGRWAKARGLAREYGHRRGSEVVMDIARYCKRIGMRYLTVYAFSTENWKRPAHEVAVLMQMLQHYLDDSEQYIKEEIRLRLIGDRTRLSTGLQKAMAQADKASAQFTPRFTVLPVNSSLAFAAFSMAFCRPALNRVRSPMIRSRISSLIYCSLSSR